MSLTLPEGLVLRTLLDNSEDTIYFKNLDSKFILNSRAHARQLGVEDAHELVGKDDFDFFPAEFAEAALADERAVIASGQPVIGRVERWERPDGTTTWLMASKYLLYDNQGQVIGTWGISRDITALKEAEQKLQEANEQLAHLSIRDSLSGLYNHRHFQDTLTLAKAQESRQKDHDSHGAFSLLLLDVDRFKPINDTYGHAVGDAVIRIVAEKLSSSTRVTDLCFRNGGDEFALVLMATELDAGRHLAEKLRRVICDEPVLAEGVSLELTVSMGVACSSEADSVKELTKLADARLYQSKGSGRNRVH